MTDQDVHDKMMKRLNVQANFALWSVSRGEMLALMHIIDNQRSVIEAYEAKEQKSQMLRPFMIEMLKCAAVVLFFVSMTVLNHG